MKEELLSVVVPVYNVEKYLDRCVSSIVNQSYDNLEIILVDDGSTDASSKICDEWALKDKRIIAIHKENNGLVSARKAGVDMASGEYITQIDSDDWIEKNAYEYMMKNILKENVDIIACGLIKDYANHSVVDSNNISSGCYREEKYIKEIVEGLINTEAFFRHGLSVRIVDKICKTSMAKQAQSRVSNYINMNEDLAMMFRLLCIAKSIMVIDKVFYHYCIRDDSICDLSRDDLICEEQYREHMHAIANEFEFVPNIKEQTVLATAYNKAFVNTKEFIRVIDDELYPYRGVYIGQKILLYGAGKFGRRLYEILLNDKQFEVVGWTDKVLNDKCINISDALQLEYDVIVIAIAMADVAEKAILDLIDLGVSRNKIREISAEWIKDIER